MRPRFRNTYQTPRDIVAKKTESTKRALMASSTAPAAASADVASEATMPPSTKNMNATSNTKKMMAYQ